jgi:putative peptidoglycan lipid II flippase
MIGIAIGTALLPMLSKAISRKNDDDARHLFHRALELALLLALPACVGLFMAPSPIVMTLFQHGAFSTTDAALTAAVLTAYTLGMPAYIAVKVYSSSYWAHQDTMSPVKASVIATVFNIAISVYLAVFTSFSVIGIAIGTSLAGWLQIALVAYGMRHVQEAKFDDRFKKSLLKISSACAILAAYLYFAVNYTSKWFAKSEGVYFEIMILSALILGGVFIYGLVVSVSGVIKIRDINKIMKRESYE